MAYALSLLFDAGLSSAVSASWKQLADAGISRSMLDLRYPPHVTLAVYDELDVHAAMTALDDIFHMASAIDVTLQDIATFGPESGVCYTTIAASSDFARLHMATLAAIREECRPHYRAGHWTPHCTLATGMSDADMDRAKGLLEKTWRPVGGLSEMADLVQFDPVVGIKRWTLCTPHPSRTP